MTLGLRGSATAVVSAAVTQITNNVPSGTSDGDFMVWSLTSQVATVSPTPTGWTILKTYTGTSQNISLFYRFASAEPASYTVTGLTSATWSSSIVSYTGVDPTTPFDVALGSLPAASAGTTALAYPAITPVTAGAWVITVAHANGAAGADIVVVNGNQTAIDVQVRGTGASTVHNTLAVGRFAWSSGAYTATATLTGTATRTLGAVFALRPEGSKGYVGIPTN